MAITKAKKGEIVEKLRSAFKSAASVVFVNFKGLSVGNTTQLRKKLKSEGVSYTVAKKTLTKRAIAEVNPEGEAPELPGELSLAWSLDLVAPAREIYAFQKKFPENLAILGGIFQGKFVGKDYVLDLAKIPSLEVLRGKFVNIINSPIQRLAIALNEVAKKKA